MPGFSSYDDLINEITTNSKSLEYDFMKVGGAAAVAGAWQSLARVVGQPGAVTDGAVGSGTPGAGGTALTSGSGSINLGNQSPDLKAILTFGGVSTVACNLMVYDRLNSVSGLAVGTTGTKNVGSPTLGRYAGASAVGVQAWLEFTTASTAVALITNLLTYTNEGGTTGKVGTSITAPAAIMPINSMLGPLPLVSPDLGVRSVETLNVGTATTTGVAQMVLLKPIATISLPANTWVEKDLVLQLTSLPQVFDGGSLCLMYQATATTALNVWGTIRIGWG